MNTDNRIVVPVCQREGCDKPLRDPNDRVYLLVRERADNTGRQAVFCAACAAEIQGENLSE